MTPTPAASSHASPRPGFTRHSLVVAVLAVGGTFGVAATGVALWPDKVSAATQAEVPTRQRCDTCGVVRNIRHSEAKDGAEAFYEFDVRLPDGSTRRSRDPQSGAWQVGDRMQLLGGERTWSAH